MGDEDEGNGAVQTTPFGRRLRHALAGALRSNAAETSATPLPKFFEPIQANADRVGGYLGYVLGPLLVIGVVDHAFRSGYVALEWLAAVSAFVFGLLLAVSILRARGQLRVLHVAALEGRPGLRAFQDRLL